MLPLFFTLRWRTHGLAFPGDLLNCTVGVFGLGWLFLFFRHLSAVLWGGWLTFSEVLKEEIIDFNHSKHNCWSVLSRGKETKKYYKEEKRPLKTLFSGLNKIHLEGKNCCWHMRQDGLELRGLRGLFCCCFFLLTLCKDLFFFFSSIWQSLPQCTKILSSAGLWFGWVHGLFANLWVW